MVERLTSALIGAMVGAVLSAGGAYLTWAKDVRSESEVIRLIEAHSPYIEDRKLLLERLEDLKKFSNDLEIVKTKVIAIDTKLTIFEGSHKESAKDAPNK